MQLGFGLFIAASLASLVAAAGNSTKTSSKCNTGPLQCCQTVQKASENPIAQVLGVLNIPIADANIPVGLSCDPISVIGIGGPTCASQPVCCEKNNSNGLVALGCTPVNVGI